jgi:hypothetical protein
MSLFIKPIERLDYDLLARPYSYLHNVNFLIRILYIDESYYLVVGSSAEVTMLLSAGDYPIRCYTVFFDIIGITKSPTGNHIILLHQFAIIGEFDRQFVIV